MKKIDRLFVNSEIGKLKKVLLHRPGKEIENLTPGLMDRLLFDDIPYLKVAQEEHDYFAQVLEDNGIEVFYLAELTAEVLDDPDIKEKFINQFIEESRIRSKSRKQALKDYFYSFDSNKALVDNMIAGVRKEEIEGLQKDSLSDYVDADYYFISDPMPNLYFTRDPFSTIGTGISLNRMRTETRRRETIFSDYIFKYHPMFDAIDVPRWYDRDCKYSIEGGDQLVLSDKVLAIGISERTDADAIEELAENIFADGQTFERILAFNIPKKRAFMHLDTVFTMVDYDKFTIHPEIEGPLKVYSITEGTNGALDFEEEVLELDEILKKYLELDEVELIRCGGKKGLDAAREQWNDGSNTLAIAPGEVVVYSRNHVTNSVLKEKGIKLHVIPSSELSRGRGGPRCMSMPLEREPINK